MTWGFRRDLMLLLEIAIAASSSAHRQRTDSERSWCVFWWRWGPLCTSISQSAKPKMVQNSESDNPQEPISQLVPIWLFLMIDATLNRLYAVRASAEHALLEAHAWILEHAVLCESTTSGDIKYSRKTRKIVRVLLWHFWRCMPISRSFDLRKLFRRVNVMLILLMLKIAMLILKHLCWRFDII